MPRITFPSPPDRQLKIPELCVIATGAQKCDTATLKDLPQLHEVMKAHAVQDNAWRKGGRGVNRQVPSLPFPSSLSPQRPSCLANLFVPQPEVCAPHPPPPLRLQHFAYELFVATEWVLNHMFPESQGPQLGGILLGDVLLHWHSRLMSMDKRYVAYVVDQAAFAPQGREFERWNQLLLHQASARPLTPVGCVQIPQRLVMVPSLPSW